MTAQRASDGRRDRYVTALRAQSAFTDEAVAKAFASVPREVFVADGFRTVDGRWLTPGHVAFLDEVYRNDPLVTKVDDGTPVSSSSQPSLMAAMLAALDIRPGVRVLEIGVGTGYNAALLAELGAEVTSVEVRPDVADRARAALAAAGVAGVSVVRADGYAGHPAGARYDRVIVTVGVTGVAPAWLEQLTPDGFVLVPVAHAGSHPVLRVHPVSRVRVTGWGVTAAGFMSAAGPLSAAHPWSHPEPLRAPLPAPREHRRARWPQPLGIRSFHDLVTAAGAWDRRVTLGGIDGVPGADWVLLGPDGSGAGVRADGAVAACGVHATAYADAAAALLERWDAAGRPGVGDWQIEFALTGRPTHPLWVPHHWTF